ncbi:MAG TPA: DUF4437 domain-containing protein [Candidatus Dormibacteraeota bacterium]|nr:DUF4437 domain-containing protein [Candidatus Dormibacteraeota bacterium]
MRRPAYCSLVLVGFTLAASQSVSGQINLELRDRGKEFVGWVQPEKMYWRPFVVSGMLPAEFKLLSVDDSLGARTLITRLSAGWKHPKGYHNKNEEIFLLSGDLTIGGKKMTKYSYAYYPAGYAHGPAFSEHGATLLHWWDGEPDFVPSSASKAGTRVDELLEDWNFYEKPWTSPDQFPKFASFLPPPDSRLKLLRQDKVTGQMTWINWPPPSRIRTKGRVWEVHTSFEEAMLLEGDLTYGECLPGGEVVGTYTAGGYFFRPAGILHGGRSAHSSSYSLFIFRSGKSLWTDYFEECDQPRSKGNTQ